MDLYDEVFAAFEEAGVRYVVVGGMAVVMSGHVRATVDLDVVVDLDPAAAQQAVRTLEGLGLQPRVPVSAADFADPAIRESWIRDKHMQVLSFYDPQHLAREVDVFVAYPLDFETLIARAVSTSIGDRLVPVVAPEHLIEMRRAAGRPRDLDDIRHSSASRKGRPDVTADDWARTSFAGTEQAQAQLAAELTPDARLELLEQLLEIAEASGALRRAREEKQQAIDDLWAS